tara:strand:- start:5456 stop:6982 length:1527 start_codon:yes stop_codon:yes gene_type:complete
MKLFLQEINKKRIILFYIPVFFIITEDLLGQITGFQIKANPIDQILYYNKLNNDEKKSISYLRPYFKSNKKLGFVSSFSNLSFYNTGHLNSENNGHLIATPYLSNYSVLSFSYLAKYIFFEISPQLIKNNTNSIYLLDGRINTHSYLNEKGFINSKNNKFEILNSVLALHYKGIGFGISNQEMWVGPGFHSSLTMSNNTQGFEHYFLGTFRDLRYKKFGVSFKYFISERNNDESEFFHTSLASTLTYYNNPTITFGFNRVHLSGGDSRIKWDFHNASRLPFEPLFGNSKNKYNIPNEPDYWDPWDQLLVGFVNFYFPADNINLYVEYGTDDSRANFTDLKAHWDHASGYIIGIKKIISMNKSTIFAGAEFMSNKNSTNTLNPKFYRGDIYVENFYNKDTYLYSSYKGRRWAAHSGSDSDDSIIMIGLMNENSSSLFSMNYERHGITSNNNPEIKKELTFRHIIHKNNFSYGLLIENESLKNFNFKGSSNIYYSNVIALTFNYYIKKYK